MQNLRTFEIKYIWPTNIKGSRIKIKDLRYNKSKIIPYDYSKNSAYEWARAYIITNHAITIDFVSEWINGIMYLHSLNFNNNLI